MNRWRRRNRQPQREAPSCPFVVPACGIRVRPGRCYVGVLFSSLGLDSKYTVYWESSFYLLVPGLPHAGILLF